MPIKSDREYRDMTMTVVELDDDIEEKEKEKVVRGYATTFNHPYTLLEDDTLIYREQVDCNAFDTNTDVSDVIFQYDHQGRVFARTSNNTLTINTDDHGLLIEANLGGTEIGRDLFEEIRGGYTNKMSFGFKVDEEETVQQEASDGRILITRTIKHIKKLYDVSAVSIPANDATSISVRNLTNGVIEQIQAERLEAEKLELKKRKLLMRAKLL